jgi:hypothetical protein
MKEVFLPDGVQVKERLVEGIHAFRSDPGCMQLIHWIKFRALMGDTFLDMDDIKQLETALGYSVWLTLITAPKNRRATSFKIWSAPETARKIRTALAILVSLEHRDCENPYKVEHHTPHRQHAQKANQ